ncbi:TatD family hydrolase [Candidatus Microgenomates bacterium]|nr:TatD family hydrolase [Candidatus Microgenomates bacterium]
MLIDTHCHLNFKAFRKDVDQVIQRAKRAGVEKMLVVGADLKTSQKAIDLAQKYDGLYASVGIHPHHVNSLDNNDLDITKEKLINLTKNKKVVAIGETGLDYFQYKNSKYGEIKLTKEIKDLQKSLLNLHLDLAQHLNLPLIIHCRQAFADLLAILTEKNKNFNLKGVLHCFSGSKTHLTQVLDLGFKVGFDGNITYSSRNDLRSLIKITPLEKILLETDSPFLTPKPFRGKRNEPKNLKIIAQKIAHLKNISLEEVSKKTTANADFLFKLS